MRSSIKASAYLVTILLSLTFLIGTSESFQKCEHERKNHEAYKALHEKGSLFVKTVVRLKLHAACTRLTASENDGAIAALSGVAVAIFTFTLWATTNKLWIAARAQADDMKESLRIAQESANSSSKQADISRLTLERTIRPVVEMIGFDYSWSAPEGQLTHWHFVPLLGNAGPVGTVNGITNSNWTFTRKPLDADFDYPEIIRKEMDLAHPQRSPIGANKSISGVRAVVPIDSVIEAYARRGHILVWGWIEYDDGLPSTLRHRTEFAVEVVVKVDPRAPAFAPGVPPPGARFSVRNLPGHNGADQECHRQPGDPLPSYIAHDGPRQDLPPDHPENRVVAGAT